MLVSEDVDTNSTLSRKLNSAALLMGVEPHEEWKVVASRRCLMGLALLGSGRTAVQEE
jgi:hypothetical protein